MALEEYFELSGQVDVRTLVLRGLGIATAFLLALQVRKALITRAKVGSYITFDPVNADVVVAATHPYDRVAGSHNVLDRRLQVHISREDNHRRGLCKGVYRVVSPVSSELHGFLICSTTGQHSKCP